MLRDGGMLLWILPLDSLCLSNLHRFSRILFTILVFARINARVRAAFLAAFTRAAWVILVIDGYPL